MAQLILAQETKELFPEALKFVNKELGVEHPDDALDGARDIIAEIISEDAVVREGMRVLFKKSAIIKTKVIRGKEEEGQKFEDYFEWEESLMSCPSHRMLAMRRGEKEDFLILDIIIDDEQAHEQIKKQFIKSRNECAEQITLAIEDGYKRLLQPSIEAEMRLFTKQIADEKAIQVFADNLRELLLASPLGQKSILAIDPGFRSGCKVVA